MHTHLIKKCEEDQIRVVEVVLFHHTIALMRGGYPLVTLFIVFFFHQVLSEFHLLGVVQLHQVL